MNKINETTFFYSSLKKRQNLMRAFETDEGGPEKLFLFGLRFFSVAIVIRVTQCQCL